MHSQLLWAALGGLLVGLLGRLAVPGRHPALWPLGPLLGIGGALGGNALAVVVLGRDHQTVNLVVAVVIAAIVVFAFSAFLRVRTLA
ncbi:MAG TPA: hypothetical protein VH372_02705 [Actinospica sp.]|jgi:uncharacterized membrane protein YeaQ/YmgE (transglycosylase-associated protein family)|nr:hypothetical protein [Actinospica sp.]